LSVKLGTRGPAFLLQASKGLGRWAGCASVCPCTHNLAEAGLRPWCRRTPDPRQPCPADEGVLAEMVQKRSQITVAVARAVFDLLADLPERAALPGHRERGQVPFRVAGNARGIE